MSYLITGLPRSRTAWMSVAASTVPGSICYHEPMKRHTSWECCFDLWKSGPNVGIADAHLGFHLERIIKEVNPRILIIRRELHEVKDSLAKLGGPQTNYTDLLGAALDRFIQAPGIACVHFQGLKSLAIVKQCLAFLMPGCTPDEARLTELMDLNIQADLEHVWDCAIANRSRADQMLGPETMVGLHLTQ